MTMSKKNQACPSGGPGKKCLTQCPTNVKEAIDWVICLTNNNGCHCLQPQPPVDPSDCVKTIANDVWNLLFRAPGNRDTSLKWPWEEFDIIKDPDLSSNYDKAVNYVKELINGLGNSLGSFIGCIQCTKTPCSKSTSATCTRGLAGLDYTYCYKSASECCIESNKTEQKKVCAKILLGSIPLIFSSLTYLFWNCCDNTNGAKWKSCNLSSGSTNQLSTYLVTLGFDTSKLNNCSGGDIEQLLCCFKELKDCLLCTRSDETPKSYAKFVDGIQNSFTGEVQEKNAEEKQKRGKEMPLQRLYMVASSYFQTSQEEHNPKLDKAKRPESISELLYWLLGLPYTPIGMEVGNGSLGSLLGMEDEGKGEDGSKEAVGCGYLPLEKCCKPPPTGSECPMNISTSDPYLLPPCYYSAFVLLSIQGKLVPGTNTTAQQTASSGESGSVRSSSTGGIAVQQRGPFLHDVYANLQFQFYYPSSARSWIVTVWDVVYALYFQLGFLYKQCKVDYATGYGWKDCKYGKDVKYYESQTWICKPSQPSDAHNPVCGKDPTNYSPLQGYLCDSLADFKCEKDGQESESKSETDSKSYCSHLKHRPSSQWCPIPMGFADIMKDNTPERKGEHISLILELYFEEKTVGSSLYQLLLFLGIVSHRTPRCLGDMFAFLCGIGRLCDNSLPPKGGPLNELWKATMGGYPGTLNPEDVTKHLKSLAGSCAQPHPSKDTCVSLCSLSPPDGSQCNCNTKYVCPLSWSVYTVFAKESSECYLSWVFYMINDFESNLNEFLKALENVDCKSGCPGCTKDQKCHKRDATSGCKCDVVKCSNILGALYRFGFTYQDTTSLKSNGKKCSDFINQLKKVAEGEPLKELIKAVNQMLYSIRLAFIFWAWLLWTVAIVYLIFGLVVDLDILHIRSHIWLKHTHNIPAFNLFAARRLKYGIQVYFGR